MQASIRALAAWRVKTKLVLKTMKILNQLVQKCFRVELIWVAAHYRTNVRGLEDYSAKYPKNDLWVLPILYEILEKENIERLRSRREDLCKKLPKKLTKLKITLTAGYRWEEAVTTIWED